MVSFYIHSISSLIITVYYSELQNELKIILFDFTLFLIINFIIKMQTFILNNASRHKGLQLLIMMIHSYYVR